MSEVEHGWGSSDIGEEEVARNPDGSPIVLRTNADGSPASATNPDTGQANKVSTGIQLSGPQTFGSGDGEKVGYTGTKTINTDTAASGIGGFFGEHANYPLFTTDTQQDPNYAANKAAIAGQIANTQGPQAGQTQIATGPQDQVRAQQMAFANALQAQANGTGGPTAAQAQLQAGTDASINSALALAHSQRGGNSSVAMKNALMQNGQTMQSASNQATQLRAQEQQAAQMQLGSALSGVRGQDLGLATSQAGLNQQTALANQQSQQQHDALVQQYMQMGLSLDQANQQSMIQQGQFNQGQLGQQVAAANGISVQNSAQGAQVTGAAVGALGAGLAMLSDERAKKNVSDGSKDTRAFLDAIAPKKYEYTKEEYGQGKYLGFLAQDIEKSEMGKEMVREEGGLKRIDTWKALSAALAALGDMHGRVKKLEK
jgi:hypothetical protein